MWVGWACVGRSKSTAAHPQKYSLQWNRRKAAAKVLASDQSALFIESETFGFEGFKFWIADSENNVEIRIDSDPTMRSCRNLKIYAEYLNYEQADSTEVKLWELLWTSKKIAISSDRSNNHSYRPHCRSAGLEWSDTSNFRGVSLNSSEICWYAIQLRVVLE